MSSRELPVALDEELDRLPPRYQEPLVLCDLEGLTRDEAAPRLGVPDGTLKKQLERGREKLADALTARGCAPGAALLTTVAFSQRLHRDPGDWVRLPRDEGTARLGRVPLFRAESAP